MTKNAENQSMSVDFTALVLGFSSAALGYLGVAPAESSSQLPKNLALAKQNIEILALLKEKTRGNLTPEEARLTEQVLADLQLKYVEALNN